MVILALLAFIGCALAVLPRRQKKGEYVVRELRDAHSVSIITDEK